MKPKFINYYMNVAKLTAELSYAVRLKVGSIIVKDDRIISIGYNGTPAGWDNTCEDRVWDTGAGGWLNPEEIEAHYPYEGWHEEAGRNVRYALKTKPEVLHAERNAIDKLARSPESGLGATLFVTHSPCLECAKSIKGAGISNVIYLHEYRSSDGLNFLRKSGINVNQYTDRSQG
jgi:dCMP deaminase